MSLCVCLLFLYAFLGMLCDLKSDRIPNILTAVEIAVGFLYQVTRLGIVGIPVFLTGIGIPFAVSYVLFLFRMLGAGDIKLLMALGAVAGFPENARIMVWAVICGSVIALFIIWRRTGFRRRLEYLAKYVTNFVRTGERRPYRREGRHPENFHFTIAIFAAVVICILT